MSKGRKKLGETGTDRNGTQRSETERNRTGQDGAYGDGDVDKVGTGTGMGIRIRVRTGWEGEESRDGARTGAGTEKERSRDRGGDADEDWKWDWRRDGLFTTAGMPATPHCHNTNGLARRPAGRLCRTYYTSDPMASCRKGDSEPQTVSPGCPTKHTTPATKVVSTNGSDEPKSSAYKNNIFQTCISACLLGRIAIPSKPVTAYMLAATVINYSLKLV